MSFQRTGSYNKAELEVQGKLLLQIRATPSPTDNSEEHREWRVKATIFRQREWLSMDLRV